MKQLTELWNNPETKYFIRDQGKIYLEILRKEQNTGVEQPSPEIPDVLMQIISYNYEDVLSQLRRLLDTQRQRNINELTRAPKIEEEMLLDQTIEEFDDISGDTVSPTNKYTSTTLCKPDPTDEGSFYISCSQEDSPYYTHAVDGNIENMLQIFTKRYEYHKYVDLTYPLKTKNRDIAYRIGLFTLSIRILLGIAKTGLILISSLSTFGVGGDILSGVLITLHSFINHTNGIDYLLNTPKESLRLMKPYKLWTDPKLNSVMLILARNIKNNPAIIQNLQGYRIKIADGEFTQFRSIDPQEVCSTTKDIMNMLFYTTKFTKPQLAQLIATTLQQVLVESAKYIRSKTAKNSVTAKTFITADPDLSDLTSI
jgi:hypothetical protein